MSRRGCNEWLDGKQSEALGDKKDLEIFTYRMILDEIPIVGVGWRRTRVF
jgi:hypothetical protein